MEPSPPVVMKFGGTSVQDAAALGRLIEVVTAERRPRIVVVSALAGVTDALSDLADGRIRGAAGGALIHQLLERHMAIVRELAAPQRRRALIDRLVDRFERIARTLAPDAVPSSHPVASGFSRKTDAARRDAILAVGELASSQIVAAVLSAAGLPSSWVDARDVIVTDETFGMARPQVPAIRAAAGRYLTPLVGAGRIPVLGGFVGATPTGATTTLGRGGSDYTASLVGAGVGAAEVQIWTDVDGVFTADPNVVERPALIPALSFHEAYELARFGAKVLHWGTLEPAATDGIPVRVLNAARRGGSGTAVLARAARRRGVAVGLAHQAGVTVADIRASGLVGSLQFLRASVEWLDREGRAATVISLSPARLVVASADESLLQRLVEAVQPMAAASVLRGAGLVAVVGEGIGGDAAAWRLVAAARKAGHVDAVVTAQSGDALVCVTSRPARRLLAHLHEALFGADAAQSQRRPRRSEGRRGTATGSLQTGAGL